MRRLLAFLLKLVLFLAVLGLLTAAAGLGWVYYLVAKTPCPEMEPERIAAILGRESPVYYRDGKEKIGVLFQDIHRQYLTYEQIPPTFVKAIVAAEDDSFFRHYGIDFPGIVRAALTNLKAGHIVQGGSTITQQTAKNLFKRSSRNYEAKLKEMLYALRLEYRFPKENILEFYCNQFYVSGNGHGLGVAARYYFDKEPAQLTLLETAFIAGSVKRPNAYNPFLKREGSAAVKARLRAEKRAEYVLGRMRELSMISPAEHEAARKGEIMFKQGQTSFALNTVMDLVKDGLASKVVAEAIARHGIDNISTSGARIISTVDQQLQTETLYSLRRELSRLDVELRGYERAEVQEEYKGLEGDDELHEKAFLFGTVKAIDLSDPEQPTVAVSLPDQPEGVIDRQGLEQMLAALVKHRRQQWAKPEKKDMADLLARLQPGDIVYVSVRATDRFDGAPVLDLERYPKLQGAALVLQQGMIRAMAGGMDNRFFNRAIDAKRLMGSTFKTFLFAAALQLGWSPLDRLDNRRSLFVFRDQAYFPRPDHKSPFAHVSMSWAGVKSENVAAVWLLHHLTDRLTLPGVLELAAGLDMVPRSDESYEQFSARMRSQFALHIRADDLDQAAYEQAVKKLEPDFLFEGRSEEYRQWKELPYGLHFDRFRNEVHRALKMPGLDAEDKADCWQRLSLLRRSYLELRRVQQFLSAYRQHAEQLSMSVVDDFFDQTDPAPTETPGHEASRPPGSLVEDGQGRLIYTLNSTLPEHWHPVDEFALRRRLAGLLPAEEEMLWGNVLIEGQVSSAGLESVQRQMAEERTALAGQQPYSMEALANIHDYRILLGLQYLLRLGREAGISSSLEPVPSFPLGSNVVSLIDSVRMYETLVTGNRYDVQPTDTTELLEEEQAGLAIIDRIEGQDGTVIYARQAEARPVLDRKTSNEIGSILQNVVRYGTGHYAWENVRLHSGNAEQEASLKKLNLPLLGKTGTANDFRNVAFLGFVPTEPAPEGAALLSSSGYAVGVYVGFDSNESMRKGSFRISGALGALPTWSRIAEALHKAEGTAERLDPVDLAFGGIGLQYPDSGQLFLPVDDKGGGLLRLSQTAVKSVLAPASPAVLGHGAAGPNGRFKPERRFMPFWLNQQRPETARQ